MINDKENYNYNLFDIVEKLNLLGGHLETIHQLDTQLSSLEFHINLKNEWNECRIDKNYG